MLEFLKKIPFVSTAVAAVTSNLRLYVEYFLIAVIVAGAATCLTLWYRTQALEKSNTEFVSRLATVEADNVIQDGTIADLQRLRQQDAKVMAGLIEDHARLAKLDSAARRKLTALENKNENVRAFLDRSIPPELVCLLNNSCDENGRSGGEGAAASPTPPALHRSGTKNDAPNSGHPK